MSNPNGFLKAVYKILRNGGVILAINHDVGSLAAKILGESCPIFDIEHTFLYDKKTMRRIFEKNGFQVLWVEGVSNKYPLSYWLKMTPLPSFLRKSFTTIFNLFGLENKKIKLKAGNLGLAARKN